MADRWSNPSGGLGVNRFRVWPLGGDSFDHAENAANWDKSDGIIGVPSDATAWPPSEGVDGGIYKEVTLLQLERKPIGECFAFFRATDASPLPDGCVPLDGRTLAPSAHDFPGVSGSVTLPDLRNASVLGADANKQIGTAAAAVGAGNIDTAGGAPGPQATGGSNQQTLTLNQIPAHNHGGGDHTHTFPRQVIQLSVSGANYLINVRDATTHHEITDGSGAIVQSQGGGAAHENRSRWVGLIWLCKVKYISSI